jgi:hypothetical protein
MWLSASQSYCWIERDKEGLSSGQLSVEEEKNSTPAFHFLFVIASHDFRFVICNESKAKESKGKERKGKQRKAYTS